MDDIVAKPIPGTEGAADPFFSPDGQWLGFFADGKLKKISMRGGTAQTLLEIVNPLGPAGAITRSLSLPTRQFSSKYPTGEVLPSR